MTFMQTETFSRKPEACEPTCTGEREVITEESGICMDCRDHCQGVTMTCDCGALEDEELSDCCGAGVWTQ